MAVGALGVAGLAGLIIGVSKAVDEAKDRVKFFGQVEVPKETVDKIDDFRGRIDKAKVAMEEFGTGSQNSAQKLKMLSIHFPKEQKVILTNQLKNLQKR